MAGAREIKRKKVIPVPKELTIWGWGRRMHKERIRVSCDVMCVVIEDNGSSG